MYIHTFSLGRRLQFGDWQYIKERFFEKNNKNSKYKVYYDEKLGDGSHLVTEKYKHDGLIMILHKNPICTDIKHMGFFYNYSLELRVNPIKMLNNDTYVDIFELSDNNIKTLIYEVNQRLIYLGNIVPDREAVLGKRSLEFNDFIFKRIDLCKNLSLPDINVAEDIMNLIHKCHIPQGYERYKIYDKKSKRSSPPKHSELIYCGSVAVFVYNKFNQMAKQTKVKYSDSDWIKSTNLLRFEVHFFIGRIRRLYENNLSSEDILKHISDNGDIYITTYLNNVFLRGNYCTYDKTIEAVKKSSYKNKTKGKMIRIVELTNKKGGSLEKALTSLEKDSIITKDKTLALLKKFDSLGVNPVTLSPKIKEDCVIPCISKLVNP